MPAVQHFRAHLYGHNVRVITDHSAVKSILGSPTASRKHARWWLKVFASGVKDIEIMYRSGKENDLADALSRNPIVSDQNDHLEVQVAQVHEQCETDVNSLLQQDPE